ncbi:MAG: SusC/RagA family TonB-linked outer membrane protein, partial [Tangfeifania sp.]
MKNFLERWRELNPCVKKLWLIMRLSGLLILLAVFSSTASVYSQATKLTLKMENARIAEVFDAIEQQSEFYFFYNRDVFNDQRLVSVNFSNQNVEKILDQLFESEKVEYEIVDRNILIKIPKTTTEKSQNSVQQQQQPAVSGTVTDETDEPLPGVTIMIKGTTQGTVTNADGEYSLTDIPDDATLVFSFVGMKTQEVVVGDQTSIDVTLAVDAIGIEEVVAVGYGVQKRINLTGAVEQVTARELETKSVANLGQALQGVVPNLNIAFEDGSPYKNPSFNIRGGTSFSGGSFRNGSPLILVDGVPMDINGLNPDDIENISVLKDAASAAIYGARAAYGVVLVTTKAGKKEAVPRVTYSASYQIQQPVNRPKLLNSVEYQEALNNAKTLDGGSPSSDDEYKLQQVKNYFNNPETAPSYYISGSTNVWVANIDPWEEFLKDWAPLENHMISLSGGTEKSNFYASVGFKDQDGLVDLGDDFRKTYNATLGVSTVVNDWIDLDSKILFNRVDTKRPHGQGGYSAYDDRYFAFLSRIGWRVLMTPRFTPSSSPVGIMPTHTPLNAFLNDGNITSETTNLLMKIGATFKLFDGLSFKTDYAYKTIDYNRKLFRPLVWRVERSWTPFVEGYSTLGRSFSKSY